MDRNGSKGWLRGAVFAALALAAALPAGAAGVLDGKTFVAESGEQGKKAEGPKDEVLFRDGKLHSAGCDPYGFADGPYTTMTHSDGTMFHAVTQSAKEGKIEWSGMVRGETIEANYVWSKPGQKPITYWLKGTLKK